MIPLPAEQIIVKNEKLFSEIVGTAFGQRRKTLRNTLKAFLSEAEFLQLEINPQLRAENLSVTDFAKIVAYVDGRTTTV
jgi:16S rRNA (adenine1518-N6/adenine1519-N6)-dimethyltransferase